MMELVKRIYWSIRLFKILGFYSFISEFASFFGAKKVKLKVKGCKYPIKIRCNTTDLGTLITSFWDKEYDFKMNKITNPEVIVDCGANIGLISIFYANKYPDAKIISIEPEESNYEMLEYNLKKYPNIQCFKGAVWSKETNLKIINENGDKNAFIVKELSESSDIRALSISAIMARYKLEKIDILKIDIEGSEKVLFENNSHEWLRFVKVLVIELHDRIIPGCSKAFFDSLRSFDFNAELRGDCICCILKHDNSI